MKNCPKCQAEHTKSGTYCSHQCANSRGSMSEEAKEQRRQWVRTNKPGFMAGSRTEAEYYLDPKKCVICDIVMPYNRELNRTPTRFSCSTVCEHELRSARSLVSTQGTGGLRKGAGQGKHGWYQGIWCDSTYELAYVMFCKSNGIEIHRYNGHFEYSDENGKARKYHPDFQVGESIVEIKGYLTDRDKLKFKAAPNNLVVKTGEDLKEEFAWIEKHTGLKIKDLHALYE